MEWFYLVPDVGEPIVGPSTVSYDGSDAAVKDVDEVQVAAFANFPITLI
jgi:hypothetical protein